MSIIAASRIDALVRWLEQAHSASEQPPCGLPTTLDLTALRLASGELSRVTEALRANTTSGSLVQRLVLERCGLCEPSALAALLYVTPNVGEVLLGRNELGSDAMGLGALPAALARRPRLHTLDLGRNALDDAAVVALCDALSTGEGQALHTLRLRDNVFGAEGAEAVARLLQHGELPLACLDMGHNEILDSGVVALAAVFDAAGHLTTLNLDCNSVSAVGAQALAAALPRAPALRTLSMADNDLGDVGTAALEAALETSDLHELHLRGNHSMQAGTSI